MAGKKRNYSQLYDGLKRISDEEGVDFGIDAMSKDEFRKKYFTGPGNIENLYNNLSRISDEEGIDFGQGSRDEWLESFGYRKNPNGRSYTNLQGRHIGRPTQPQQFTPQAEAAESTRVAKPVAQPQRRNTNVIRQKQNPLPEGFGELSPNLIPSAIMSEEEQEARRAEDYGNNIEQIARTDDAIRTINGQGSPKGKERLRAMAQQLKDRADYAKATEGKELKDEVLDLTDIGITPTLARDEEGNPLVNEDGTPIVGIENSQVKANTQGYMQQQTYKDDLARNIQQNQEELAKLQEELKELKQNQAPKVLSPLALSLDDGSGMFTADTDISAMSTAIRLKQETIERLQDALDRSNRSFWHGVGTEVWNENNFLFGIQGFADNVTLERVKMKIENGEQISLAERALLETSMESDRAKTIEQQTASDYYNYGKTAGKAVHLVKDYLLGGKIIKSLMGAGAALGVGVADAVGANGVSRVLLKGLGIGMGDLAAGFGMTTTIQSAETASHIMEKNLGNVTQDEQGNFKFEGGKDALRATFEGIVENTIENATEAGGVNEALGGVVSRALGKRGLGWVSRAVNNLTTNKFLRSARIQSLPEEILEEYEGQIAQGLLVDSEQLKELGDAKTHRDIILGTVYSMGVLQAPHFAHKAIKKGYKAIEKGYKATQYYRYKRKVDKADKAAFYILEDKWESLRSRIDETTNDDMATLADEIANSNQYTDIEKTYIARYITNLTFMRGYNSAELNNAKGIAKGEEDVTDDEEADDTEQLLASEDVGYNATEPEQKQRIKNQLQLRMQTSTEVLGEDVIKRLEDNPIPTLLELRERGEQAEIRAALDYVNAKYAYDGMIDRVQDDIDVAQQQADYMIRRRTNFTTLGEPTIIPVITKQDKRMYITDGEVSALEDGSIDLQNSNDDLIAVDEEGNVSFLSANDIKTVEEQINPAQALEETRNNIAQELSKKEADEIDGVLPFLPNDVYQGADEQGTPLQITILQDNGDGSVFANVTGLGEGIVVPKQTIQSWVDGLRMANLQQEEAERLAQYEPAEEYDYEPTQDIEGYEPVEDYSEYGNVGNNGSEYEYEQPFDGVTQAEAQAEAEQYQANRPAMEKIPVLQDEQGQPILNKKGRPQYLWTQAPVETTADALSDLNDGILVDARGTAQNMKKQADEKLQKVKAQKVKGDDPIEEAESRKEIRNQVQAAQAEVDYWKNVTQEINRRMSAESARIQAEIEAKKTQEQREAEEAERKRIAAELDAKEREAIRKEIEKDSKKRNEPYKPLVEAKKEMADDEEAMAILQDTEPRDLAEWVSSLIQPHSMLWQDENGQRGLQSELGLNRSDIQKFISLLAQRDNGGKPFAEVVDAIYSELPDAMKQQYTDQDVRNTLLDLFNEGSVARMRNLAEEHRIEEARAQYEYNRRREEEAELQAWADAFHLSPEERESFEAWMEEDTPIPLSDEELAHIINIIEQDNEQQSGGSQEVGNEPDTTAEEGGNNELPSEQPRAETTEQPEQGSEDNAVEGENEPDNVDKPLGNLKEVKEFLKSIGYNGSLSKVFTDNNGKKVVRYQANGVISPMIVFGETTRKDVYRQFHLYRNIMDVNIPTDLEAEFEREQAERKRISDALYADDREQIKNILTQEGIPFHDVIDSERGSRIVFTDTKNENGNYTDWMDVSDPDQVTEDIDFIRERAKRNQPTQEQEPTATSGNGYTITPAKYTTKRGKELDMQLITFDNDLTKEQKRAADKFARDKKGWFDRAKNGYMMRSEADAEELAKLLGSEKAVQEAQPISLADIQSVTDEAESKPQEQTEPTTEATEQPQAEETTQEQPQATKPPKSKYVSDEDAERFAQLKERLRQKLLGQMNMGYDPEIFTLGVEMTYMIVKNQARKFADYAKAMIEEMGDAIRPYLKAFYNGARELPELEDVADELTPYEEVRTFDVANFDKEGAKDLIKTAEVVVKEDEANKQAEQAKEKITQGRNEKQGESVLSLPQPIKDNPNYSSEEQESLVYRKGESMEEYGERNNKYPNNWQALYLTQKYADRLNDIANVLSSLSAANANEVGKAIADIVESRSEGYELLSLLKNIPVDAILPYQDAVSDAFKAKENINPEIKQLLDDYLQKDRELTESLMQKDGSKEADERLRMNLYAKADADRKLHKALMTISDDELTQLKGYHHKLDIAIDVERDDRKQRALNAEIFDRRIKKQKPLTAEAKVKPLASSVDDYSEKNEQRPILGGVYNDAEGFGVVTDGHILVAIKELYDKKSEGKIIATHDIKSAGAKKGDVINGKYVFWRSVIPSYNDKTAKVDWKDLANFLAGVTNEMKERWKKAKEAGERINFAEFSKDANVALRLPDGSVIAFKANSLAKFVNAARQIGTNDIAYSFDDVAIISRGDKGLVMLMPVQLGKDKDGVQLLEKDNVFFYDNFKADETRKETKKEESIKPQSEPKQEQPTLQLTNEQEEKPKKTRSTANQKGKIEDVGEHLWGARKDIRKEIAMNLANITEKALIEKPFGKVYKKPDLKKAVESGALREKDAMFYEAFFSIINQQKPKSTQRDARMKRWSPSYKTKIEEWAETTYKALDTLRLFVEAEEADRDAVIEAATKDHYPNREQELAEIEKRKMWNPDRTYKDENGEEHIRKYEWGDKTTPNQLWITYEVMKRLGYNVGDKLDIPYGIIKANTSGTGYSIENLKGESNYKFGSNMSLEEAIDMIVYLARLKRGDSDISHPTQFFYFSPTKSEYGKSGRYRVMWGGGRLTNIKYNEFNSKEEADAFAAKKKSAVVSPIEEVKRRYGYRIGFSNPLTGDRFYVDEAEFDTKEEAKAHFDGNFEKINDTANAKIDEERAKKGEKKQITADDVVRVSMVHTAKDGWKYAVLIDAKYANNLGEPYIIRDGFDSRKDAVEFANGIKDEVLQTVLKHKEEGKKIVYFDTGEDSRFGEDYRNGKDVTAEDFMNTFGFRGVQFGNWANQADRQMAINQAYDAFLDMAKLIGVSPKAMSLNGELGIAFGARGVGGFLAHYEGGDSVVINLTKTRGAGSLAHEWWHALDNYLSRMQGDKYDMVTDNRRIAIREELRRAFDNMLDMVSASDYAARSRGKGEYWGRMHEITARLLAEWVDRELKKRGELNTFLSRGANIEKMQRYNYDRYAVFERLAGRKPVSFEDYKEKPESLRGIPYPSDKEIEQFGDAMRNIFDTIQEREDEETGNTILFREGEDEELQDEQIHSQSFKGWFGDWENEPENASKVVGENGRPLVVYRGADFNPLEQEEGKGVIKPMRYFTPDESYANRYGTTNAYYLNIRHPFDIRNKKDMEIYKSMFPDYYEVVKTKSGAMDWAEMGAIDWDEFMEAHPEYDGLIVDEGADPDASEQGYKHRGISYVPLHGGTQVKSATANSGAFSNESEDVRMRTTDTLPFYSNAARAVEQVKQDKATPEQWLKMIEKNGGLKSGEDKWIGLSDWLKASKAKSLTKQEVMDYIRQNQIQIEETEYANKEDIDIPKSEVESSEAFQGLLEELTEYDENDYPYINQEKFKKMRHDDNNFFNGFKIDYWGETIEVDDPQSAALYLGLIGENVSNEINETRLSYTTQGLENKREIALTVPTIESWNTQDEIHFGDAGQGRAVAWVRFGEATDADGNRVLVIDEIQSKRHQEGREKGYKPQVSAEQKEAYEKAREASRKAVRDMREYRKAMSEKYGTPADYFRDDDDVLEPYATATKRWLDAFTEEERAKYERLESQEKELTDVVQKLEEEIYADDRIPSAPFEKNWHELAMKRMLRYAAENGFDKVAWTTGEQQAERYGIGDKIKDISISVASDPMTGEPLEGKYDVFPHNHNNHTIMVDGASGLMDREQVLSVYGKDLGQRMIDAADKAGVDGDVLSGDDLRIGGEGMKGFYDEILPRFMNKYGKKWGAKVGTVELPNVEESAQTMWAVDVTPEMKESVMQGQPMFRQTQQASAQRTTMQAIREAINDIIDKLHITDRVTILESTEGLKGKKARAKGWFDVSTGKIVVVLPNNRNAADAMRTILHEAVAHMGLRELFGKEFNNFLMDVYSNSSESIRRKINANAAKKGWDIREATEEYLASLAETQNFEQAKKQGTWNKVKEWFNNLLSKVGIPKLFTTSYDDNELRYILWRSWRNLTEGGNRDYIGMAEDVVKREDLGVGEFAREDTELSDIESKAKADGTWMKAPNGKPTNLTERQWLQVRTKAFKKWFGDWENNPEQASKVVDENGEPRVVYHGSRLGGFSVFADGVKQSDSPEGTYFFSSDKNVAYSYSGSMDNPTYQREVDEEGYEDEDAHPSIYACFLNIREPYQEFFEGADWQGDLHGKYELVNGEYEPVYTPNGNHYFDSREDADEYAEEIGLENYNVYKDPYIGYSANGVVREAMGYSDGVIIYDIVDNGSYSDEEAATDYVVFSPNQIKSATDNNGEFDDANEDIRFREDEEIEPTSDVARTVYDSIMSDRKKHIQEAWQDGMISIKEAQDAVLDTDDKPLRSYEDAYQFENHMHGISRNEAEYFERNLFKPLLKAIDALAKESGKTANDVYRYLMLKHGLERNKVFAERDARKEHEAEIKKINDELKAREDAQKAQEKVVSDLQGKLNDTNLSQEEREKLEKKLKAAVEKLAEVTLTDKQKAAIEKRIKIENAKFDGLVNHIADPDVKAYYDQQLRTIGTLRANGQISEEEYNKRMANLSRTYLHGNKDSYKWRDYSGLMAVTGADTLDEAERLANEEINDMESLANEETRELWQAVNAATQWTLRKSFDSGEMTRDNYEAIKSMFKYYVPLRGWAETRASDVYDYMGGKGEVFSPVVRNAFGRMSEADNPIAYIGNMAVSAIVGGNKNLLKQHLLRFAQNHPNALFTVSEQWYQNTGTKQNPKWVAVSPDIPENATAEQIDAAIKQFDEDMKALEESGMATKKKGKLKVNYPEDNARLKEHQVRVRVNGKEYVIYVNGNPRVAQAINGKLRTRARENSYESSKMANINRAMAQNFTSRNPAFIFSNASRDLTMAMAVVGIKESAAYNKKFYATLGRVVFRPRAVRGGALMPMLMGMYLDNKIDDYIADTSNDEKLRMFAKYFKEFMTNGGETGFTSLRDVDTFKRTMQKEYGRMNQGKADPRKMLRKMGEGFEYMNRCVEDMTRFVTFATSRQMGRSIADSVTDAKNVTLNFNRKGSGGMYNATFRNFYIFVNPAIQSLHLLWQLASDKRTRKAFTVTTLSFATAGALMPIINAVIYAWTGGGDDDDYWNLPTWVRRNNICFKIPYTGSFITIPLAQEFRVFYGLGELVASALLGHPDKNAALSATEQVTDLLPISFTGANGNLAVNLAPTLLQPLMQVSNNVDFTGKPIRKITPFNEDEPAFQKAYRGTPSWMVKSSELINELTGENPMGENKHSKGWIEGELMTALHLNYANDPAVVNHILKGYFGGMYSFISGATGLATTALSREMPKSYEVPILNRFINIPLERTENGSIVLGEEYYGIKREMEKYQNEIRGFERDAKKGDIDARRIVKDMRKSDKYKHYKLTNALVNKIDDMRNKVKQIPYESARENANIVMGELYDKLRKVDALTDEEAARLTQIKDNDEFNEIFSLPIGEMKKRLSE